MIKYVKKCSNKGGYIMRATGLTAKIDYAGRIIIPSKICSYLGIKRNIDTLEFFVDEDKIVLKKYKPICSLCGSFDDLVDYKNTKICRSCINELSEIK